MELVIYDDSLLGEGVRLSHATRKDIRGVSINTPDYHSIRFDENGILTTKIIPKAVGDSTNILDEVIKKYDPNGIIQSNSKAIYDLCVEFEDNLKKLLKSKVH